MRWTGLARNLKRVPRFKIQRALLDAQFRRAEIQLSTQSGRVQIEQIKRRVAEEYEVFCGAVAAWTHLREQWLADAKRVMLDRWEHSLLQSRLQELERGLKTQHRRMRVLGDQITFIVT